VHKRDGKGTVAMNADNAQGKLEKESRERQSCRPTIPELGNSPKQQKLRF